MTLKIAQVFLICALVGSSFSVPEWNCTTPDGGFGVCTHITNCPHLNGLLRSVENEEFLLSRLCGDPRQMNVCCNDCYTPDGKAGLCTSVQNCPHIIHMLQNSERIDYFINSICRSGDKQVCCGPPPSPIVNGKCQSQMTAFPVEVASGCCGVDSNLGEKITGGKDTQIEQYPWLVILEYVKNLNCGGSLISGRYVLTAAHCVSGKRSKALISVRLGEYDTSHDGKDCVSGTCNDPPVIIPIEEVILHPEYDAETYWNDIALIRLKYTANYTYFIRPICLPWSDVTEEKPLSSLKAYAAGWGKVDRNTYNSDVKQHVSLPLVNMGVCQRALQKKDNKIVLWSKQICAGGVSGEDACNGDSGGPLMIERTVPRTGKATHEVTGVVSVGLDECGTPNVPGVYTKVYEYNNWIRSSIRP